MVIIHLSQISMPQDLHNGSRTLSINVRGCRVSPWLSAKKAYFSNYVQNGLPYLNARNMATGKRPEPEVELIEDFCTYMD